MDRNSFTSTRLALRFSAGLVTYKVIISLPFFTSFPSLASVELPLKMCPILSLRLTRRHETCART
jgi:hypothetical protein